MEQPKKRNIWRGIIALVLVAVLTAGGIFAYYFLFKPNVPRDLSQEIIEIPTGADLEEVIDSLNQGGFILDEESFRFMADRMNYAGRPGRFRIGPGWTNRKLVRHLRSGQQEPVNLILVNERLPEDVAAKAALFIEPDSQAIINLLTDSVYLDSIGYSPQTLMSLFIPNTYQFYWNTTPRKFVERMLTEHDRFWEKEERGQKAAALQMTKEEVYTLASIVERETNLASEKKRIAGLYLNRLQEGMPLQADPTLVFASRDWETRSLARYKTLDSPYNTYMYPGLPPGPISMAAISSIDAVLNREDHNYLYMCAIGDETGGHNFSETYDGHLVNIRRYKNNLRRRGL